MRTRWMVLLALPLLALLFSPAPAADEEKDAFTNEGFVRTWLVLAPIPLDDGQSGADGLSKEQLKDEAKLQPKDGDKVKAGGKDLAWKKHKAEEHLVDFNAILGAQTEDSVAYAVCYLVADEEMKGVKMKTGSDDQLKVYLNGKKVHEFTEPRSADKDQDTTDVTLQKGVNVLVCKVVNEKVDWSLCVRFVDKDDKPVKGLKVQLAPKKDEK
jgi:hypothetical protein